MNLKLRKVVFVLTLFVSFVSFSQEGFIGEVRMFAGNFPPRTWAFCEGQLLPISQNQALFSILGTMYGGDGRTTFGLPDLRGRIPMGMGSGPGLTPRNSQGQKLGSETNTLTTVNLPSHNHTVNAVSTTGNSTAPGGHVLANTNNFDNEYSNASANTTMNNSMIGNTGGSQAVNNIQPSTTIRFIICLQGVFPSRN